MQRELGASLRAFLAVQRGAQTTTEVCREFFETITSSATSNTQLVKSAYLALKEEAHHLTDKQKQILDHNLSTILTDDNEVVYIPKPTPTVKRKSTHEPSHVSKRVRTTAEAATSTEKDKHLPSMPSFYLLKSEHSLATNHSIALDEIVLAGADLAVVCNFKFDVPWMWNHAPALQTCRKLLIVHGETSDEESQWSAFLTSEGARDRVRFVRPKTPPYGTVHSKMFLLFYAHACRVCIHTANMIESDWEFKTQGAYMRDFPLTSTGAHARDAFRHELCRYVSKSLLGTERDEVLAHLGKFDFSSAGAALVASVPGVHTGESRHDFGHARLRKLLQLEDIDARESSVAICQFSSLGSIQEKWLEDEFKQTLFASSTRGNDSTAHTIKLVYPTLQQVQNSNEGLQAGASLPVSRKNLYREHILNKLHKWDGRASGCDKAMPHIKTFLRYPAAKPHSPNWLLVGSFNLSVAAWGRMQGKKSRGNPSWDRLNVLSYELGVLFTPRLYCPPKHVIGATVPDYLQLADKEKILSLGVCRSFEGAQPSDEEKECVIELPIPYKLPPVAYERGDKPWTMEYCALN